MNKALIVVGVASLLCFAFGVHSYAAGPMAKDQIMVYKADQLVGVPVLSPKGEAAGRVSELIIDEEGRVTFVVIHQMGDEDFGTDRYVAIPFGALTFTQAGVQGTRVYVNLTREELRSVPSFNPGEDMISQAWAADVYREFGQRPYWTKEGMKEGMKEPARANTWDRPNYEPYGP